MDSTVGLRIRRGRLWIGWGDYGLGGGDYGLGGGDFCLSGGNPQTESYVCHTYKRSKK